MKLNVDVLQDSTSKVSVLVEAAEVDSTFADIYRDFSLRYNFPGFRKGKAPRKIIDATIGKEAIQGTVAERLVNIHTPYAIDDCGIVPLSDPQFDEIEPACQGSDFQYSFSFSHAPFVELSSYEPVELELFSPQVSDEELNAQLEAMRENYYHFDEAPEGSSLQDDSYVNLNIAASDDKGQAISALSSDNRPYTLGSGLFSSGFDAQLKDRKVGDKLSFDLQISDDADLGILLKTYLGKTSSIHFDIEITSLKVKTLPELNDEWAQNTLGFESFDEFVSTMRTSLETQKKNYYEISLENAALAQLCTRSDAEVPQAMIEQAQTQLLQDFFAQLQKQGKTFDAYLSEQGIDNEHFKEDLLAQATDSAKQEMVLDAYARHFQIEVSEEELNAEFEKSGAENPADLKRQWKENGRLHLIRQGVIRAKAAKKLMDEAIVTYKSDSELNGNSEGQNPEDDAAAHDRQAPEAIELSEQDSGKE